MASISDNICHNNSDVITYPQEKLLLQKVENLLSSEMEWSHKIMCRGYTSSIMLSPSLTDICPLMMRKSQPLWNTVHKDSSFRFDTNKFQGCQKESIVAIKCHIVGACRDAGFYLTVEKSGSGSCKNQSYFISFQCSHNKKSRFNPGLFRNGKMQKEGTKDQSIRGYRKTKNLNGNARKTSTVAPEIDSKRCGFRFRIFCSSEDDYWYLGWVDKRVEVSDPGLHTGHVRLPPEHVKVPLYMIPTDDLELLQQCKKILASDPFVANLLCERTQLEAIRPSQINYLAKQLEAQKIVNDMSKASSSSAELLLQKFDDIVTNHNDVSYVALIHSSEQGYKLRVPKGRPTKSCTSFGTIDIESIRKSMHINDGQDVLLAFAWTTRKEEELARKFPEVFVMDVTEKTNIEKRGMFIVTGIDGNNKIFIALHCFMPNGYLESYNWIYDYAFPLLVGDDVLRNNQIVITDGEFALYDPLVNLAQTDSPWSGTKHLLCEYHLLEQEWMRYVNPATKSSEAVELCDKYKKWMVSWFKEYYTESQFKHSFRLFEDHLESSRGILGSACASAINDLWGRLKTKTYKWAFPYKNDKFHLDIIASSMTEAINGGMKQIGPSPLASKTLADSSAVMIHHSNNLERKRELYNSVQVDKTPLWSSSITKHYLTSFAEGIAIHDFDWCREKVIYVRIDEYTWYAADRDYMSMRLSKKLLIQPEYSNVFMVKLNQETLQHLTCRLLYRSSGEALCSSTLWKLLSISLSQSTATTGTFSTSLSFNFPLIKLTLFPTTFNACSSI